MCAVSWIVDKDTFYIILLHSILHEPDRGGPFLKESSRTLNVRVRLSLLKKLSLQNHSSTAITAERVTSPIRRVEQQYIPRHILTSRNDHARMVK